MLTSANTCYSMTTDATYQDIGRRKKEGGGRKEREGKEDLIGHGNILSSYPCKGRGL